MLAATLLMLLGSPNYLLPTAHLLPLALGAWAAGQQRWGRSTLVGRIARLPGLPVVCVAVMVVFAFGLLGSTVPAWIGLRSYGIYLYGLTVTQLIPRTGLRLTYCAPLDILATGLLVWLSFRYVELPAQRRAAPTPAALAQPAPALTDVPPTRAFGLDSAG